MVHDASRVEHEELLKYAKHHLSDFPVGTQVEEPKSAELVLFLHLNFMVDGLRRLPGGWLKETFPIRFFTLFITMLLFHMTLLPLEPLVLVYIAESSLQNMRGSLGFVNQVPTSFTFGSSRCTSHIQACRCDFHFCP
ncbi:unnamed protein product [Lactuca saligna]|uniref:Uncharacterized protein n=1 Tax=Lactuca saligna TaxID=75948 RepID=A0AA35VA77_LACSI|nr:unnamed protein product [Lactuca saligna]